MTTRGSGLRQAEQIIGAGAVGNELEDAAAGDIRRAVIQRHDGNFRAALASRDVHETRQSDVSDAVGGGAAHGVGHNERIVD